MTPQEFIAAIAPAAQASAVTTKIPASFTVAQAALESGWGKSELAQQAYNLFGVKADSAWKGDTLAMVTGEVINNKRVTVTARWRRYPDWLACINDHAAFLMKNPRYRPAFEHLDGIGFARAVAAAGYATDPDYGDKLVSIIRGHGLAALDVVA